jgi:hypothetical protein
MVTKVRAFRLYVKAHWQGATHVVRGATNEYRQVSEYGSVQFNKLINVLLTFSLSPFYLQPKATREPNHNPNPYTVLLTKSPFPLI